MVGLHKIKQNLHNAQEIENMFMMVRNVFLIAYLKQIYQAHF